MAAGVKNRNDHKSDSYQADQNNDSRCHSGSDQRFNGAPMTDIPDDDDLAEVKIHNKHFDKQNMKIFFIHTQIAIARSS